MNPPPLILASGSPQRRRLLAEGGYRFAVIPPEDHVECGICSTGGPAALVVELAVEKAAHVAARLQEGERPLLDHAGQPFNDCLPPRTPAITIVACDTVAECGGQVLGKPRDEMHAADMLRRLRGNRHRVYSGLCIWPWGEGAGPPVTKLAVSELFMEPIDDAALDEYLASGLWEGKAGAFGYQDRQGWLRLESGSEANVVGLPVELLAEMLTEILKGPKA